MEHLKIRLKEGKKAYFASDFHLGTPTHELSRARELKIISWLDRIKTDAQYIFLVGDIFDFWFEYKHAIPKGFVRFQGKLAELIDSGIEIIFFTGNHDMWMFSYFTQELGIKIYRENILLEIEGKRIYLGHGDGLGPGDHTYKFIKKFFASQLCQWLFQWLHPNIGFWIATGWSKKSRAANTENDNKFFGDKEWLLQYSLQIHPQIAADYYVFGHRHFPMEINVPPNSQFINIGDWLHNYTYGEFSEGNFRLKKLTNQKE
ncbi:MAG: UDP-2,3-diacylglucosamine diphosphatase [Cytophagales bacterium]|nr:UDP-2,3-diacylglucosamine diphosphatase [Cytophagales bacterium]